MKHSKKVEKKLKARQGAFEAIKNKTGFTKPGSQNIRKS